MGVTTELARRGVEWAQEWVQNNDSTMTAQPASSSAGLIIKQVLVYITTLLLFIVMFKVRYTIGHVMGTLAIIESPTTEARVSFAINDDDMKKGEKEEAELLLEPEVTFVKAKPVTASIHNTMGLLRAQGGRGAGLRGVGVYVIYAIFKSLAVVFISAFYPTVEMSILASIAAEVLLAKYELIWVHTVISSSSKRWFHRVRETKYSEWSKIIPAALLKGVVYQLTFGLPAAMIMPLQQCVSKTTVNNQPPICKYGDGMVWCGVVSFIALSFLALIPAQVTYIRVAASMLPEEESTLVPFDRSFGGKVLLASEGGSGKVGLLDAWKTFKWPARLRYLGLMVKLCLTLFTVGAIFVSLISAEIFLLPEH